MYTKSVSNDNFLTRSTQWLYTMVALVINYVAKSLPQHSEPFLDERADLLQADLYSDPHMFI
jgi:hypothetical protein